MNRLVRIFTNRKVLAALLTIGVVVAAEFGLDLSGMACEAPPETTVQEVAPAAEKPQE
jgi:hypothetical protein